MGPLVFKTQVGSRTGAVTRRPSLVCIRGFPLRARLGSAVVPSPIPATSHAACGFPALRAPARFASRVMGPIELEPLSAQVAYSTASCRSPGSKLPDHSAFTLTYTLRLRSCRSTGAFIITPLPHVLTKKARTAGPLCSTGVTPLHRYYGPSRHRLAFDRFPGVSGYTAYLAPPISRWGEDGFSSCMACPCHRATPTTPPEWLVASVRLRQAMLPSPEGRGLGLRS